MHDGRWSNGEETAPTAGKTSTKGVVSFPLSHRPFACDLLPTRKKIAQAAAVLSAIIPTRAFRDYLAQKLQYINVGTGIAAIVGAGSQGQGVRAIGAK